MSELPKSWEMTELGEICNVIRGITFPAVAKEMAQKVDNVCCLRTTNIQREVEWADVYFVSEEYVKREEQFARVGDILMSMSNSYELVGKVAVVRDLPYRSAFGAFISAVRPVDGIDARYLFHLLRTDEVQAGLRQGSSQTTNIANISIKKLSSLSVPVAPANEQKRIAIELDALLARVDAGREHLDRVPNIFTRYRQSILAAATSGKLTNEWRKTSGQLDNWSVTDVQSIATVGTGSTPLRSNSSFFSSVGTPWVTSAATSRPIVTSAAEFVTDAAIAAHRLKLYPIGTLLVAMYGEGKTRGQVTELGIEATINQACAAIKVDETCAVRGFVKIVLQANYFEMRDLAEGGNQPNLNLTKIKKFGLKLPGIEEQREIVNRTKALMAHLDKGNDYYVTARVKFDRITPALLSRAFRGEIVAQNPDDESASELLERIRVARLSEETLPKPRRATRKKSMQKITKESVKKKILSLPDDIFSFDDLRNQISANYDELKDVIFSLLVDPDPILEQVFDVESEEMRFVRKAS